MGAELHLPDLPEVEVALGRPASAATSAPTRAVAPLGWRVRDALSSYLPLLLMALMAVGTAWLVKHTPSAPNAGNDGPARTEPDYTMNGFAIVRFAPDGHASMRIEGQRLRHYPDTDRIEIEGVRIHAVGDDGRITDASAQRALANGDASELQLIGRAQVRSRPSDSSGDVLQIDSEFLHAFTRFETVRSHLPVKVLHGAAQVRAGGIEFDNLHQQMQLAGPVHMLLAPSARR